MPSASDRDATSANAGFFASRLIGYLTSRETRSAQDCHVMCPPRGVSRCTIFDGMVKRTVGRDYRFPIGPTSLGRVSKSLPTIGHLPSGLVVGAPGGRTSSSPA